MVKILGLRGLAMAGSVLSLLVFNAVPAHAAASQNVTAGGNTPLFNCSPEVQTAARIDMSATQSRGVTSGYFSIQDTATFGQVVSKYGQITRGTVSKGSYNVSGPVTPYQCVVPLNRNPVLATINGVCGNNVAIHYKDELGESGEFFGNAVCT